MTGKLLFDTNAASALIRGGEAIRKVTGPEAEVLPHLVVVGELLYGAFHSGNPASQLARVRQFTSQFELVFPDEQTTDVYGHIKADLRKQGMMIPDNDLWVAASAVQLGIPIVTQDAHFGRVGELTVIGW